MEEALSNWGYIGKCTAEIPPAHLDKDILPLKALLKTEIPFAQYCDIRSDPSRSAALDSFLHEVAANATANTSQANI